jgi:hypothetical protein
MADYQQLRQRHVADLAAIFPEWVQRLRWPAERLREERQRRLRALLRVALASSRGTASASPGSTRRPSSRRTCRCCRR